MKRDIDLCRNIMLKLEKQLMPGASWLLEQGDHESDLVKGYTNSEVIAHVQLLSDEDLVIFDNGGIERITSKGHDFLDLSRENKIWEHVKSFLVERGIPITLQSIIDRLKEIAGNTLL